MYVPLGVAFVVALYFMYLWLPHFPDMYDEADGEMKGFEDMHDSMFDDWPRAPCPCPCECMCISRKHAKVFDPDCFIQFEGDVDDEVEILVGKKKKKVQLGYSYGRAVRRLNPPKGQPWKEADKRKLERAYPDGVDYNKEYWIVFSDLTNARLEKPYCRDDLERVAFMESWGIFGNEAGDTSTIFNMWHLDMGITIVLIWFVIGFTWLWYLGWVQPILKDLCTYAFLASVVAVPVLGLVGWILSKLLVPVSAFVRAILYSLSAINHIKVKTIDAFNDVGENITDFVLRREESDDEEVPAVEDPQLPQLMMKCKKCVVTDALPRADAPDAAACKKHKEIYRNFIEKYRTEDKKCKPGFEKILRCMKCKVYKEDHPCKKHQQEFRAWQSAEAAAALPQGSAMGCFPAKKMGSKSAAPAAPSAP